MDCAGLAGKALDETKGLSVVVLRDVVCEGAPDVDTGLRLTCNLVEGESWRGRADLPSS